MAAVSAVGDAQSMEMEDLFRETIRRSSSDLHLKVGRPPIFRTAGELVASEGVPLGDEDVERLVRSVTPAGRWSEFEATHEAESAVALPSAGRFRLNVFRWMGHVGCVARLIPLEVPTIEGLELPAVLKDIVLKRHGVVLVTGPTGSGKSTTLAAMIEEINNTQARHVITIEDPIEFVYADKVATITQRELGLDTLDPKEALKRALRQDPDVILMGEVDRIVDAFPSERLRQLRTLLSTTLMAVLSQRLLRRSDGSGRIAAVEVLISTPRISKLIYEGNTLEIEHAISVSGRYYRMQTFNQCLARMAMSGAVSIEEALSASPSPGDLRLLLRGVLTGASGLEELERAEKEAAAAAEETHEDEIVLLAEATHETGGAEAEPDHSATVSKLEVDRSFQIPSEDTRRTGRRGGRGG
jgi:Tfp pilus assembly pilus retraction ATPase PilT